MKTNLIAIGIVALMLLSFGGVSAEYTYGNQYADGNQNSAKPSTSNTNPLSIVNGNNTSNGTNTENAGNAQIAVNKVQPSIISVSEVEVKEDANSVEINYRILLKEKKILKVAGVRIASKPTPSDSSPDNNGGSNDAPVSDSSPDNNGGSNDAPVLTSNTEQSTYKLRVNENSVVQNVLSINERATLSANQQTELKVRVRQITKFNPEEVRKLMKEKRDIGELRAAIKQLTAKERAYEGTIMFNQQLYTLKNIQKQNKYIIADVSPYMNGDEVAGEFSVNIEESNGTGVGEGSLILYKEAA